MNVTAKVLRQLEREVARDAETSIIVLAEGHYLQIEYNDGRELYRRRIEQFDFGHGGGSHDAMLKAWEEFSRVVLEVIRTRK